MVVFSVIVGVSPSTAPNCTGPRGIFKNLHTQFCSQDIRTAIDITLCALFCFLLSRQTSRVQNDSEMESSSALGQTVIMGLIFLLVFMAYYMIQGYAAILLGCRA